MVSSMASGATRFSRKSSAASQAAASRDGPPVHAACRSAQKPSESARSTSSGRTMASSANCSMRAKPFRLCPASFSSLTMARTCSASTASRSASPASSAWRSSPSFTSSRLPENTVAKSVPMGMTASTPGTWESCSFRAWKSSMWPRSGVPMGALNRSTLSRAWSLHTCRCPDTLPTTLRAMERSSVDRSAPPTTTSVVPNTTSSPMIRVRTGVASTFRTAMRSSIIARPPRRGRRAGG